MEDNIFYRTAYEILNERLLEINKTYYRICDIELYLYTDDHKDPYAKKCNGMLKNNNLHIQKNKNNGSFLFIGLGGEYSYFGAKIRTIKNLENDIFIEGINICTEIGLKHSCKKIKIINKKLDMKDIYNKSRTDLDNRNTYYKEKLYRYTTINNTQEKIKYTRQITDNFYLFVDIMDWDEYVYATNDPTEIFKIYGKNKKGTFKNLHLGNFNLTYTNYFGTSGMGGTYFRALIQFHNGEINIIEEKDYIESFGINDIDNINEINFSNGEIIFNNISYPINYYSAGPDGREFDGNDTSEDMSAELCDILNMSLFEKPGDYFCKNIKFKKFEIYHRKEKYIVDIEKLKIENILRTYERDSRDCRSFMDSTLIQRLKTQTIKHNCLYNLSSGDIE